MSKLVNWGHWLSVAALGAAGVCELILARADFPLDYRLFGALLFWSVGAGILFWKRIGYAAAIGVCALGIEQVLQGPPDLSPTAANWVIGFALALIFVWLLVPDVRARFGAAGSSR